MDIYTEKIAMPWLIVHMAKMLCQDVNIFGIFDPKPILLQNYTLIKVTESALLAVAGIFVPKHMESSDNSVV